MRNHTFQPLELGGPQLVDAPGRVRVAVVPTELLQELRLALVHLFLSLPQLLKSQSQVLNPTQTDQITLQ